MRGVVLHPLAEQFASVAGAYERGRPEYPPSVVGALAAELQIEPGARVVDLAAGTGKLTRALLAAGLDVVAIEPQASLRELLAASIGSERALEGLAEAIPLADGSVAAVTVADAFHWFDQAAASAWRSRGADDDAGLEHGFVGPRARHPDSAGASSAPAVRWPAVARVDRGRRGLESASRDSP
jgi:SAM-dependent methyltransferase